MKPTPEACAQLSQWQRTVFFGTPTSVKVMARQRQEPLAVALVSLSLFSAASLGLVKFARGWAVVVCGWDSAVGRAVFGVLGL